MRRAGRAVTWAAPGRVNLIGEHLDYNGGPVLPFALEQGTMVSVSRGSDGGIRVTSQGFGTATASLPLTAEHVDEWARYPMGAAWAFAETTGDQQLLRGLAIDISSTLPSGAGLASSAAVECAVICALDDLTRAALSRTDIAELAIRAEHEFVGVPCGPMDQLAAMLSEPDHALLIDTRTLRTTTVPLPLGAQSLALLVIDTRVQHALDGGEYADRRASCEAAAKAVGVEWLADADRAAVDSLQDRVLRRRARHVLTETQRVHEVVAALSAGEVHRIGPVLTASHRSLAEDFEVSCPELDGAVEAALFAGALGARMTGAGFGGCAIALCPLEDVPAVTRAVESAFATAGWTPPAIWSARPGPGARRCRPRR